MWSIVGVIIAIALFAKLSLIFYERTEDSIRKKAFDVAAEKAAYSLATFYRATRSYAQATNASNRTVDVQTLISSNYLPKGFSANNDFGQVLEAKIGATWSRIAAYWKSAANFSKYRIDSSPTSIGYAMAQMKIANLAVQPVANIPGIMVGIASGANVTSSPPYSMILIPGSSAGSSVGVTGFSLNEHNAVIYSLD